MQRGLLSAISSFCLLLSPAVWDWPALRLAPSLSKGAAPGGKLALNAARSSPLDLEISGDLTGLPPGQIAYLTREQLLALPQVSYTVDDDSNFPGSTRIAGVELEQLARELAAGAPKAMVVAGCDDLYRAHYPQAYRIAHQPLLVLEINGRDPESWPKSADGSHTAMGPYLISQPHFTPSFKILSHTDEAQIPWGVVRLEFQDESVVLGQIAPRGANPAAENVQAGYRIAQQNCFRCHALASAGRQKGGISWEGIGLFAKQAPQQFAAYVRNPQGVVRSAKMPGNPNYDRATVEALSVYFQTFSPREK